MNRTSFFRLLAFVSLFPATAQAATIVIGFEGTVTGFRTDEPLQTPLVGFQVGQPVVGWYAYDGNATGAVSGGDGFSTGQYFNAISQIEVHVGDYFAHAGAVDIQISDNHGNPTTDTFQFNATYNRTLLGANNGPNYLLQFAFSFSDDITHTAFDSAALPQGPLDLSLFNDQNCFINFMGPSLRNPAQLQGYEVVQFEVTRMTLGQIREPSSVVLAALGLVGLAAWGWRRRR